MHRAEFRNRDFDYACNMLVGALVAIIGGIITAISAEFVIYGYAAWLPLLLGAMLSTVGTALYFISRHLRLANRSRYYRMAHRRLTWSTPPRGYTRMSNVRDTGSQYKHTALEEVRIEI